MTILNFISQNKDLLSLAIVCFTGLFGFVKWIDTRRRELSEKRYKTYMDLIGVISGKRADSTTPNITEQIAATWFLSEYEEYYGMTQKIFADSDLADMANEPWVKHVLPHIQKLIREISK
ncbi:hypothetical protein SAMN02745216_01552 [Desulfatibacillum alkenivorans DSM 16219]|uniref:Uncharacterized protein n=1 Tax=Desulfatibacillum alkenivorans DSM 16219 TaxID=1121393 RepID=A0A1M6IWY5_9BACT|nr:hypothetical protein [Desulfatibacillum alkenivorans]SHJ38948.1 hypothetical protein SAMN02745216_01552 [Desulfatibacillum alkenivorans DSM 16219]